MADKDFEGWVGLFLPEDEGRPCLIARDAGYLKHAQLQLLNRADGVIAPVESLGEHKDQADLFAARQAPAGPTMGDEAVRGEIRAKVVAEARRAAIESEIRDELGLPEDTALGFKPNAKQREALGLAEPSKEPKSGEGDTAPEASQPAAAAGSGRGVAR